MHEREHGGGLRSERECRVKYSCMFPYLDRARPGRHPMLTMSLSQLTPRLSPLHRACLPATLLSLQVATFSHRHR